jgi:hypothetical protein
LLNECQKNVPLFQGEISLCWQETEGFCVAPEVAQCVAELIEKGTLPRVMNYGRSSSPYASVVSNKQMNVSISCWKRNGPTWLMNFMIRKSVSPRLMLRNVGWQGSWEIASDMPNESYAHFRIDETYAK